MSEIEKKYYTTFEYEKFTNNIIDGKIKNKKLFGETDFDEKLKKNNNKKVT